MTNKTLKKTTSPSVSVQLKEKLLNRIRTGYYRPGERMDAIRKIADEFKVSTLTAQKACKLLEQEGAIIPVPQSGLFVNEAFFNKPAQQMRIVFVFPEVEISARVLDMEGLGLISELNRGFQAGAQENGIKLDFLYINKASTSREQLAYARQIRNDYDFAIFSSIQLPLVQKELVAADFPVFALCDEPKTAISGTIPFYYDHQAALEYLLDFVRDGRPEKIVTVSSCERQDSGTKKRVSLFTELCKNAGYENEQILPYIVDKQDINTLEKILQENKGAFIFCNDAYLVRNIYIAAMRNGQIPGRDFMVAAIATGFTFTGLIPSLTYVRVPTFELGLQMIRTACTMYCTGAKKPLETEIVRPELIINESAILKNNKTEGVAS